MVGAGGVCCNALHLFGVSGGQVARAASAVGAASLRLGRLKVGAQVGQQRRASGGQLGRAGQFTRGHTVHQRANVVVAGQQQHHQLVGQRQLARAHLVQHAFDHMGESHHMVQAKQAAGAFDGVRRAKDGVDQLGFVFCVFHRQKRGFHVFEQLAGFFQEHLQCVVHFTVGHVSSLRFWCWRPSPDGRQSSPLR